MKLQAIAVALSAMLLIVAAEPDINAAEVEKAIHQQSEAFLESIYAAAGESQPDGSMDAIEELITAAAPESIRQDVAKELKADGNGALSDGLKERINHYVLQWSLQYVPEDLRKDVSEALEEYQTTGRVSNNKERNERVRRYLAVLSNGRNKRGFWGKLFKTIFGYISG
uniref:Putative 16.6 kDa secreted protein n=1 Tax=Aedes aegypti TaxID=7159 RepID=Q58HB8_AEDAE|nr:putative 16.6 kDa secreted protein [Aedes aegypti]